MDNYYVYEHRRLDNDQCFYVGKGHGDRYKHKSRNEYHDKIAEKYGMKAVIVKDNMTEREALDYEKELISYYVNDLGYGIAIEGHYKKDKPMLTNHTFGGDGFNGAVHTEEWRRQHSIAMTGENNPMYGVNIWNTFTDEQKEERKQRLRELNSGENNPMYGISPQNRMDENTYNIWQKKVSERCKQQIGEKNPNYGNDTLHNKIKDNPELRIQYFSRPGAQNGRATKVHVYKDDIYVATFEYITLCAKWLKETLNLSSKLLTIQGGISESVRYNKPYRGYTFVYEK